MRALHLQPSSTLTFDLQHPANHGLVTLQDPPDEERQSHQRRKTPLEDHPRHADTSYPRTLLPSRAPQIHGLSPPSSPLSPLSSVGQADADLGQDDRDEVGLLDDDDGATFDSDGGTIEPNTAGKSVTADAENNVEEGTADTADHSHGTRCSGFRHG